MPQPDTPQKPADFGRVRQPYQGAEQPPMPAPESAKPEAKPEAKPAAVPAKPAKE